MSTDPKTVDETVKALKCCSRVDAQCIGCDDCPFEYCGPECNALCKNAHDLIESLQAQLAESQRRERAAVEDWKIYEENGQCDVCKYGEGGGCAYPEGNRCRFEWRGQQEAGNENI